METMKAEAIHQLEKDIHEHTQAIEALQSALWQSPLASCSAMQPPNQESTGQRQAFEMISVPVYVPGPEDMNQAYLTIQRLFTQWKQVREQSALYCNAGSLGPCEM